MRVFELPVIQYGIEPGKRRIEISDLIAGPFEEIGKCIPGKVTEMIPAGEGARLFMKRAVGETVNVRHDHHDHTAGLQHIPYIGEHLSRLAEMLQYAEHGHGVERGGGSLHP